LWEEYKQANSSGYAYSWFCELFRVWRRQLDVVLRHVEWKKARVTLDYHVEVDQRSYSTQYQLVGPSYAGGTTESTILPE
jgi:transposase